MDAEWFKTPGPEDTGFEGRCNARKKNTHLHEGPQRCRMKAGWRTDHEGVGPCVLHGGMSPGVKTKYVRQQAAQLLNGYGLLREGPCDPRDLLVEELSRTAGTVDYLQSVLGELTEEQLFGRVPLPVELETGDSKEAGDYWKLKEAFGVPVILEMYRWERAHLAKLSAEAVKLGLLERAVRVEEAQATMLAAALNRVLEAQGFSPAQLDAVKAQVIAELQTLELKTG